MLTNIILKEKGCNVQEDDCNIRVMPSAILKVNYTVNVYEIICIYN